MKVVTVVGARPQFIKCAAVTRELRRRAAEVLVHTGQHYDDNMSAVFFRDLDLPHPDYHLGVGSGTHGSQTGAMLSRLEAVFVAEQPDVVLLYGDTNSTLAGALAAAKLRLPVAHIEAGLRSFNRDMPEEVNRVVVDHLSTILFCPTESARQNLAREGITAGVHVVGDVMYDALVVSAAAAQQSDVLSRLGLMAKGYILATIHRAENTDDVERLESIMMVLERVGHHGFPVVLPLHPRTRQRLGRQCRLKNVLQIPAVPYLDMLQLERNARVIITDSGGVQKEAYWLRVPCLTLRAQTEWIETVSAGVNKLVGRIDAVEGDLLSLLDAELQWPDGLLGPLGASRGIVNALIAGGQRAEKT